MDSWFIDNLICPIDRSPLKYIDGALVSSLGRKYPVIDNVPIMLIDDTEQTIGIASASIARATGKNVVDHRAPELYLESLGVSEAEKEGIVQLANNNKLGIDPVVAYIIGATSGYAYKHLMGNLSSYPIPELRLPITQGEVFLDLGCNWGRWSIAAARKGYTVIGIDPSLGAVMAARRVAKQLGHSIRYIVADARYLPFRESSYNTVFSYSVLQHFSKENVRIVLSEVARVLKPYGTSLIQMPNILGVRCLYHQAKRGFREAHDFEVRYWTLPELKSLFTNKIGNSSLSVDCYFGLGLQKADLELMSPNLRLLLNSSEFLRAISLKIGILKYLADSVYIKSIRASSGII